MWRHTFCVLGNQVRYHTAVEACCRSAVLPPRRCASDRGHPVSVARRRVDDKGCAKNYQRPWCRLCARTRRRCRCPTGQWGRADQAATRPIVCRPQSAGPNPPSFARRPNRLRVCLPIAWKPPKTLIVGAYRSPVAHLSGGQGVVGSNPAAPTIYFK